jgi:hypothetical protein
VNGFIEPIYTQLGTTSNYSAIANLHSLKIIASNTKSSPACSEFTSRFLVTASNSEYSSASALTPFPADHRFTDELRLIFSLAYNITARTTQKHPVSTVLMFVVAVLHSNSSTCRNIVTS